MFKKYTYLFLLSIALVLFATTSFLLIKRYIYLQNNETFKKSKISERVVLIEKIQGWMTFEYLNRNFNLPQDYLQKELGVISKKYPNITLGKVGASQGISVSDFTSIVKEKVRDYQNVLKNNN